MLPKESYTIENTFVGSCLCENCGRVLTNIATVKGESGKEYFVGLDCAETLSSEGWEFRGMKSAKKSFSGIRKFHKIFYVDGDTLTLKEKSDASPYAQYADEDCFLFFVGGYSNETVKVPEKTIEKMYPELYKNMKMKMSWGEEYIGR